MFPELVLLHRTRNTSAAAASGSEDLFAHLAAPLLNEQTKWFHLPTCLREIWIGPSAEIGNQFDSEFKTGVQTFRGSQAYLFCLEVICGLHSPLVGETEVFGQFKTAVAGFEFPETPVGMQLQRFFKMLFEDAKKIRAQSLKDLGSQSYGSILRRELKGISPLHILGSGQLVQEILPWIQKDGAEICIYARNLMKAQDSLGGLRGLKFSQWQSQQQASGEIALLQGALIIAAPIATETLNSWLNEYGAGLQVIVDLRADSSTDPLNLPLNVNVPVLPLDRFFERIAGNQAQVQVRKGEALLAARSATQERSKHIEYRPFGWEDVCA
jgi:glutamyl-tRNA reductase